jgi:hypothetical protein
MSFSRTHSTCPASPPICSLPRSCSSPALLSSSPSPRPSHKDTFPRLSARAQLDRAEPHALASNREPPPSGSPRRISHRGKLRPTSALAPPGTASSIRPSPMFSAQPHRIQDHQGPHRLGREYTTILWNISSTSDLRSHDDLRGHSASHLHRDQPGDIQPLQALRRPPALHP